MAAMRRCLAGAFLLLWAAAGRAGTNDEQLAAHAGAFIERGSYRGWTTWRMGNGLLDVHVVPELGGRVMQVILAGAEFFWVNPELAGRLPPPGGLGPEGAWLNYGGDKLWPAPQGWDHEDQWPGPPDAVLDGLPYACTVLNDRGPSVTLRLTSDADPRTGVRLERDLTVYENCTRVRIRTRMRNIDTRLRRWALAAVTQLNAQAPDGPGPNPALNVTCPLNPSSRYPAGYRGLAGEPETAGFVSDLQDGHLRLQYRHRLGKVGLDTTGGWVASQDGRRGTAFVQWFRYEQGRAYPDGVTVALGSSGGGVLEAWGERTVLSADPAQTPCLVSAQVMSPFARLRPGETAEWDYAWGVTRTGPGGSVRRCGVAGVTVEPLTAVVRDGRLMVVGRFGVVYRGTLAVVLQPLAPGEPGTTRFTLDVAPDKPVLVNILEPDDPTAGAVALILSDAAGRLIGELARCTIAR